MGFESCHPAVNFLFFAAVLYGSASFTHPVFLAVGFACAFAYGVKRAGARRGLIQLGMVPLALLFACYYASYHHFGVTVLKQNFIGNNMTLESFAYGLMTGLRGVTVCMWLGCLFSVVTSDKVVYLLGRISPLLSLGVTILLRLFPRIRLEGHRIHMARKGIGRGMNQGNVLQRVKNALAIFSMLITWIIQALALEADSMRSRGALLRGRKAFSIYRFDNRDRGFVILLFLCITLTAMGAILGATEMFYNPRIIWKHVDGVSICTVLGYGMLCLLPPALELWTQWRFAQARKAMLREK